MASVADPRALPGEPLALDLLNTEVVASGKPIDCFDDRHGVERWLAANNLPLGRALGSADGVDQAVRDALIEVRAAIRGVLSGNASDRARFDRVLAHGRVRVGMGQHGTIERTIESSTPAWFPAVVVAMNLAELLDTVPDRIRRCAHPNCVLWFLDTTRNGTRRWCSMAGCGNRAKAQRHYERRITPR